MNLIGRFLDRAEYADYADFKANAKLKIPERFNFGYDVIDEYAVLAPNKRALLWCNDRGEEREISFGELSVMSNRLANAFLGLGLKKGDVVMTMLNRRWEYWATIIACHKIGLVLVPATFLLTPKDIAYRIDCAKAKALIATDEDSVIENIDAMRLAHPRDVMYFATGERPGYANFDSLIESGAPNRARVETSNDDICLVYFTSGTTGYPRMVAHDYLYPLGFIFNAAFWQRVKDDGLHFTFSESGWAKCSWGKLYGQWLAGACVFAYDFMHKFSPIELLEKIEKYRIDTFCAPPTVYRYLIKEDLSKCDLSSLTRCSTAGEALNPEVSRQFFKATGLRIFEGYGQTETSVIIGTFGAMRPKAGSMGKPSPLYDVRLVDDSGAEAIPGVVGEIVIKRHEPQASLIRRYLDGPACPPDGFHRTGDLAYYDEDGYFWFIGRKDDVIKSSGYRIGPFEVESALMEHPAVLECAITGAPDERRGQIVKATVVLSEGYFGTDELVKELQDFVKKSTAPYKYPRRIEFVKELPKTISGKIRRIDIRAAAERP